MPSDTQAIRDETRSTAAWYGNDPDIAGAIRAASSDGYSLKRAFDLTAAIILLLVLAPLLPLIALAIRISSSGPVFVRQIRLGQYGKTFAYLKFRTMISTAPEIATGQSLAVKSDPRITAIGRFLRETSLDELPALLNVVSGDMSIVGPRAALPLELARYSRKQLRRLQLKPGITGYWQVYGRSNDGSDFARMIRMDLLYVRRQSLLLDLKILLRTAVVVLYRKGAY